MIETKEITYRDGNTSLIGWLAQDNSLSANKPIVLVIHDWSGRNEFACQKASQIAALGYIGFAVDMYGNAKIGTTNEEKSTLMNPFMVDRARILRRLQSAIEAVKNVNNADSSRIAAIGFCFGGLCALDLARNSYEIAGVVSLHGLLSPPSQSLAPIQSKVLVLHGHDDPMVPPDHVLAFEQEMTKAKADWQLMIFGGTKHAFSNPLANDDALGTVYNPVTDRRAWIITQHFLSEILL